MNAAMTRVFHTLIVDDEPLARHALRRMLAEFPNMAVCGEAETVDQAAELIGRKAIDVVFLDIELIGETGFDLLPRIDAGVAVIFVTAFDRYAIRAFEVNALDYLLKPVTEERLAAAIRRLGGHARSKCPPPASGDDLLRPDDMLLVNEGRNRRWLRVQDICAIQAQGDFTVLYAADGSHNTMWRLLADWQRLLPEERFVRVHRSWIVNLSLVESFGTGPGDRLHLHLSGMSDPCVVSRRLTPSIRKILAGRR